MSARISRIRHTWEQRQLRSLEALLLQNAVTKVAYMQAIEILGLALSRLTHSSKGRALNLNLRGVVL